MRLVLIYLPPDKLLSYLFFVRLNYKYISNYNHKYIHIYIPVDPNPPEPRMVSSVISSTIIIIIGTSPGAHI